MSTLHNLSTVLGFRRFDTEPNRPISAVMKSTYQCYWFIMHTLGILNELIHLIGDETSLPKKVTYLKSSKKLLKNP